MKSSILFFNNFFAIIGLPFKTITTTDTSISLGGLSTSLTATDCLSNGCKQFNENGDTLAGSTSIVSATATVMSYLQSIDPDYPDINLTQSYVESLSEEELNELIINLDEKENTLKLTEKEVVLSKKI